MNKRYFKLLCLLLTALYINSCNALDLSPSDRYDISYAFKTPENAILYLNSFYPITQDFGQFGSCALGGANSNMSDGLTDILKYGGFAAGVGDCNLIMTEDGRQSTSQNYFDAWTTCYEWIRRLNEFLDGLEDNKANFSEENYRTFKAEALYFRAYSYFMIMRSHASKVDDLGVIIHKDLETMTVATKSQARADIKDSYDFILDDINYAIGNLPTPQNAGGRVNKYVACALKARAMLYAERYSEAKAAAEEIKSSGLYSYIDDYSQIFKTVSNSEVIWGFECQKGYVTHTFDKKYSQPGDVCANGDGYGGGYAGPTQEFVDMFDYADGSAFNVSDIANRFVTDENCVNRDPRLAATVLWNGASWKGRKLECYEGGCDQKYFPYGYSSSPGNSVTGYYMRKLLDEDNRDFVLDGSYQPWIEFRYAEIMLICAECLAREEKYGDAYNIINELRKKRFGRDDVKTQSFSSLDGALDVILKERAVELCFEGHRFWDLRRTGRAKEVLDGKKYTGVLWKKTAEGKFTAESVSCDMGARRYPEKFDYFPIPQKEISNNSLAKQNSNW